MKPLLMVSIHFLICLVACSYVIAPHSAAIGLNNTLLRLGISAPIPPFPPQVELAYTFNERAPLDPTSVYEVSLKAIFDLSRQPWSGEIILPSHEIVELPGCYISLHMHKQGQGLQPGYIILAIYDTVLRMYNKQPGFNVANCQIFLRKQKIGFMGMFPYRSQKVLSGSQNDTMTESEGTEGSLSLVNGTGTLTDDSDVIVDPTDPRFTISWRASGQSIPAQDMFSSALDGTVSSAQYGWNQICSHALGVSFSGNVAFHIGPSYSEDLLCGWMVRTFILIVMYVARTRRVLQEMDFTLSYQGKQVGSGYIMKLPSVESHGGNGTDGIASS